MSRQWPTILAVVEVKIPPGHPASEADLVYQIEHAIENTYGSQHIPLRRECHANVYRARTRVLRFSRWVVAFARKLG